MWMKGKYKMVTYIRICREIGPLKTRRGFRTKRTSCITFPSISELGCDQLMVIKMVFQQRKLEAYVKRINGHEMMFVTYMDMYGAKGYVFPITEEYVDLKELIKL